MTEQLRDAFRDAMAQVAAPVSVVTTTNQAQPFGATVSAFASLSLFPPMVLVSLDDRGSLVSQVVASGRFALNVLSADQVQVAETFARRGATDRFEQLAWRPRSGLPCLAGALAWVACDVDQVVDAGDHTLLIGRVIEVASHPGEPLVYHERTYSTVNHLSPEQA